MSQEMISLILKPMFGDMFGPIIGNGGGPPAPTIVSQNVLSDGVTLRLVGSVALTAGNLTGLTASNVTMASASIVGGNLDIAITKVYDDQPVGTITYDGTGTLASATGAVAAFGPVAITNDSAQLITGISGTVDLWKWNDLTRMWTEYTQGTLVSAIGDPVGFWGGQLDVGRLNTTTSTARPEYQTDGVLWNSLSATKNLYHTLSQAATAPFSIAIRANNSAALTSLYAGAGFGSVGAATFQHVIYNDLTTGVQSAQIRNVSTVGVSAGQGDVCAVLSFNGTTAFLIENDGTKTTLAIGTGGSTVAQIRLRAALGTLAVSSVKYLQAFTTGVSEADARAWIAWARGQA